MHHDFRERETGTLVGFQEGDFGKIGWLKRVLWFEKKDFGESEKWITFAELSPENWGEWVVWNYESKIGGSQLWIEDRRKPISNYELGEE